jgi:hypothetical protein
MELTVLAVPGCPNAPVLERRLAEVLAARTGVTVARREIADAAEAARWGMRGRRYGISGRPGPKMLHRSPLST